MSTQTNISWPRLVREVGGLRVKTLYPLSNGHFTLPAGTLGTITGGHQWDMLQFRADACPHCGVQVRVTRCSKSTFQPISEG